MGQVKVIRTNGPAPFQSFTLSITVENAAENKALHKLGKRDGTVSVSEKEEEILKSFLRQLLNYTSNYY